MWRHLLTLSLLFGLLALAPVPTLGQDDDGDGLSAAQEAILGSDPSRADTDDDGLSDGAEYWEHLTDPVLRDSDGDGLPDPIDPYPWDLTYQDLNGTVSSRDRVLGRPGEDLRVYQLVEVKVGNVITIDWTDFLNEDFFLERTEFTMSFDFLDPQTPDYEDRGYYHPRRNDAEELLMEIRLPSYSGLYEDLIPWPGQAVTVSDWAYHLYGKPLRVGQTWEFNVFYHELLRWGEAPFFRARAEVIDTVDLPLETRLGRRDYPVYEVRAVFTHGPFEDPFLRAFLGERPTLVMQAFLTVEDAETMPVILRYTTPFFRITPTKSVGLSDFLVQR